MSKGGVAVKASPELYETLSVATMTRFETAGGGAGKRMPCPRMSGWGVL